MGCSEGGCYGYVVEKCEGQRGVLRALGVEWLAVGGKTFGIST